MPHDIATDRRLVYRSLRVLLVAFSALTLLAVASLFGLSGRTDRYFAWTIAPPLTAAFMGAGYGAGTTLVVLSLRTRYWAVARVPIATIFVFTVLTLLATLLHLDRFHFTAGGGIARFAAWFWMAVYVVIPVSMLAVIIQQEREPGEDPPKRLPLPVPLRPILAAQGAVLLVAGVALYMFPKQANHWWPWRLTPLTARAVASWLLAFALAAGLSLWERDLGRLELAAIAYTVFGILELIALARYTGQVHWDRPAAWVYTGMLVLITATGAYGWRIAQGGRAP